MKVYETLHLVKTEDLNHHGTLFAARAAAWFIEAAFTAAGCVCGSSEGIVCRNLHTMSFQKPVQYGTILRFLARVAAVGSSSFMVMVRAVDAANGDLYIEGAVTFVTIEEGGKKRAHHITLDDTADEEEARERREAERIRKRARTGAVT